MYQLEVARSINFQGFSEERIKGCREAGIMKIEISSCNPVIDFDEEEMRQKAEEWVRVCQKYGIEIISVHLPFGRDWELCSCDDAVREKAMAQYMKLIEIFKPIAPQRFILHPGYPRVPAEERPYRKENFKKNGAIIAEAIKPAKLAVENMPQDCLGNTADELIELVEELDNVCVCFDSNHWYQEKPHEALAKLAKMKKKVETLHISDYDGLVEKHWLAGEGVVEWNKIIGLLEEMDYRGPFLHECGRTYTSNQVVEATEQLFKAYNEQKMNR